MVGTGLLAGMVIALGASRLAASLLYGISPLDGVAWLGAVGVLLAAGVVASLLPALTASRVDPVIAMRVE
jgi:putative ABC transport system permease protein